MKTSSFIPAILVACMIAFTGCEVIGGIFKAGVWVGIVAVVAVLGLIGLLISRAGKK